MDRRLKEDRGAALLAVFILAGIAFFIVIGSLDLLGTSLRSTKNQSDRSIQYYQVERSLYEALAWLRDNSSKLTPLFGAGVFYENFERISPTAGSNDNSIFMVPSRVRIRGTTLTPLLVSDALLGSAAYPLADVGGQTFDADTAFSSIGFKDSMVRVTLVDAMPVRQGGDYGDPNQGNPPPSSDFYPIYRIDVMTDLFHGAHLYGYTMSGSAPGSETGLYGLDFVTVKQNCDSYRSDDGVYGGSNRSAGCSIGSNGTVGVGSGSTVYGAVSANSGILSGTQWRGRICATLDQNCPEPGRVCQGAGCTISALPPIDPWQSYCPTDQGDLIVNSNRVLNVTSDSPNKRCWRSLTVRAGRRLTLRTTDIPYFFESISIANNARLLIDPTSDASITVYTRALAGGEFTTAQIVNLTGKPGNFLFNYHGQGALRVLGSDNLYSVIFAPLAQIELAGDMSFFGTIRAKSLLLGSSGMVHLDASIGGAAGAGTGTQHSGFTLHNFGQRFR